MEQHPDTLPQLANCGSCRLDNHSRCIDISDPGTRVCGCEICH